MAGDATPRETPAWLLQKVDQRLAALKEHFGELWQLDQYQLLVSPLVEPDRELSPLEQELEERTCDNCGAFCPLSIPFFSGVYSFMVGNKQVLFSYGTCERCRPKELKPDD